MNSLTIKFSEGPILLSRRIKQNIAQITLNEWNNSPKSTLLWSLTLFCTLSLGLVFQVYTVVVNRIICVMMTNAEADNDLPASPKITISSSPSTDMLLYLYAH